MPSADDFARPVSDDELDDLGEMLDVGDGPNIDYCMGFLTAVASTPSLIAPSHWLPVVLGNRRLEGTGDPLIVLILRLYNTIVDKLTARSVYHPPADEIERIEDWCSGYVDGVRRDRTWIDKFEAMRPVFPMAVLAGRQPLNEPGSEDHIEDEEAWKQQARENLDNLALMAYAQLRGVRRAGPPKPGRNDPCSCGSGKKYKKCCLGKRGTA